MQRYLALDDGTATDPPAGLLVDLHAAATGLGTGTVDQQVALSQRIGIAVHPLERGHQQGTAAQAAGVADRGHHHIDLLAGARRRRQLGGDHHRGNVAQLHVGARRHGDAQLREHVGQTLSGERRLHGLVARAVEAYDQAIADQGVVAHAGEVGDIAHLLRLDEGGQAASTSNRAHRLQRSQTPSGARKSNRGIGRDIRRANVQEEALQPTHVLRLVDIAVADILDTCIGDLGRRHGVLPSDRAQVDYPGEADELGALVDGDLLLAAYPQVTVGQHLDHRGGQGAGEGVVGASRRCR